MGGFGDKYLRLLGRFDALKKENEALKQLLLRHGIDFARACGASAADGGAGADCVMAGGVAGAEGRRFSPVVLPAVRLSLDEKVALFRSVFRGRDDVFARRWHSATSGKSGYQPVCANEWRRGLCDKKAHKCAACPNRDFAPLTDADIYRHLEGRSENATDVVGLYAIMADNSCAFLCADFDDKNCAHGYKDDVGAFVEVCREWLLPCAVERSRSGNGAHVWIVFEESLPARKARRLGNAILTEAMKRNVRLSFGSYDRFFPNQDFLPDGGLGNLVALPLQGRARKRGNSVFVDDDFLPYQDQWAYLWRLKKASVALVDAVLAMHGGDDLGNLASSSEHKPWAMPEPEDIEPSDFKAEITITKADQIYIPLNAVSAKVVNHLKRIAAFKNPEFYRNQQLRLPTYGIPRVICCAEVLDHYVALPRGCEDAVAQLMRGHHVDVRVADETNHGRPIRVAFNGVERPQQQEAIQAMLNYTCGVLSATTAFGKTVTAAAMIARKRVNTLILVHNKALLAQWKSRLEEFLTIDFALPEQPKKRGRKMAFSPIGCLDSTGNTLHGVIDVALMQSCFDDGQVRSFVRDYGMVIVDECHHVSSVTFERVLKHVTAQAVFGLTATPIRKDGHQPIIFMQCGPIRYLADAKSQIQNQSFSRRLVPRFTSFRILSSCNLSFASLSQALADDALRNQLIVDDVVKAVEAGRTPIVLTSRTSHVDLLARLIGASVKHVVRLVGTGSAREKHGALERLQRIPGGEPLAVVATGKYVGEGFDYPRLDTLLLALPISWKGLVAQYAGRLHREHAGKTDVRIYDYIDIHVPACESMYRKRLKGYAAIGYRTLTKTSPTLFDTIGDTQPLTDDGQIFTGKTFTAPFIRDLKAAQRSVFISSPKLHKVEQSQLVSLLTTLSSNGIETAIATSRADDQAMHLRQKGLTVHIIPQLTVCATIIDAATVWYGSINPLSHPSPADTAIKLTDPKLSATLITAAMGRERLLPKSPTKWFSFFSFYLRFFNWFIFLLLCGSRVG
ncbi:MAG: DEAD/DEAH box helicase family protein [Bacteroidales bacterium]|nr:DEAD/DEAH box helicase family protein [Bacteroidales bacterium]